MIIIRNNIIPFPGFAAINLFGILFVRKNATITDNMIRHESIHTEQMKEMLFVPFYLWYVIEWLLRLIQYRNTHTAYRNISFEREAYASENDLYYLDSRKRYSWVNYLKNNKQC